MTRVVAPALGISSSVSYDADRGAVVEAVRGSFMKPFTDKSKIILQLCLTLRLFFSFV